MIETVLKAGLEAGFSVMEAFQEKIEKKEYENIGGLESVHQVETDRLIARAFWDTGDPVGFVLSTADPKSIRGSFSQIRSLVKPDRKKNCAHLLPREIRKHPLDILDREEAAGQRRTSASARIGSAKSRATMTLGLAAFMGALARVD